MKIHLKPINQQVVVLFGATSGIGLETALRMAEKGARVAIIGRSQEGLDIAVDRVREHMRVTQLTRSRGKQSTGADTATMDDHVIGIEADTAQWESVKNAADQVMSTFGRIDTWVHLAAVSEWALFEDTSPDEFRQIIEINLVGQAYGAMAALPYLKQQGAGALIFVSSVAGRMPIPYQSAYVASKHGILGMADSLRLEMRHNNIPVSVTTILPSSINTPLFNKARTKLGVEPAPMPPVYDPRIAANAIMYAAQHPVRELTIGGAGIMMQVTRRFSQPAGNNMMKATGFTLQHSDEPKSAQEADNLYHHIAGYNQVEGEYGPQTKKFSMYTWYATHPIVRYVLVGALVSAAAFLGFRWVQSKRKKSFWQRVGKSVKDIEIPRLRIKKSMPQKIAHQAQKQVKKVSSMRLPFVHHAAWYESIPLISLLPFLKRKSVIGRARDTFDDTVSSVGKSARNVVKVTSKTASETAGKASDRFGKISGQVSDQVTSRFSSVSDKVTDRAGKITDGVGKTVDKNLANAQKKAEKMAKKAAKQAAKTQAGVREQVSNLVSPLFESANAPVMVKRSRMPFGRREKTVQEIESTTSDGRRIQERIEDTITVMEADKIAGKVQDKMPARRSKEKLPF